MHSILRHLFDLHDFASNFLPHLDTVLQSGSNFELQIIFLNQIYRLHIFYYLLVVIIHIDFLSHHHEKVTKNIETFSTTVTRADSTKHYEMQSAISRSVMRNHPSIVATNLFAFHVKILILKQLTRVKVPNLPTNVGSSTIQT